MIVFRIVRRKVRNWIKTEGTSGTQGSGLPGRRANGSRQRRPAHSRGAGAEVHGRGVRQEVLQGRVPGQGPLPRSVGQPGRCSGLTAPGQGAGGRWGATGAGALGGRADHVQRAEGEEGLTFRQWEDFESS